MVKRSYSHFPDDNTEKYARQLINDAATAMQKADKALIDGSDKAVTAYQKWFGTTTPVLTLAAMQVKIHRMLYCISNQKVDITYNQFCTGQYANSYASANKVAGGVPISGGAAVVAANGLTVDICPSGIKRLTVSGGNSMLITVIHEFSHSAIDTSDAVHPGTGVTCDSADTALTLVPANAALAVNNAESIAQFVCQAAGM